MGTYAIDRKRPSRDEALAIAAGKKAARARRTGKIRKAVVILSIAAFLGPFAVIYEKIATGPSLATTQTRVAKASAAPATTSGSTSSGSSDDTGSSDDSGSSGSGSSSSASSNSGSTSGSSSSGSASSSASSPAPVTTQQS